MKFESEEPAHGTFTSLRYSSERLMDMDSQVFTYPQRSGVNEADTCAFALKHLLDEQGQWDGHFFFQFNKTVIGDDFWKEMAHMTADLFHIEMFQTTVARVMEKYHYEHDFRI